MQSSTRWRIGFMKNLLLIGILFFLGCASKVQLSRPTSFQEVAVAAFDFTVEPFANVKYEGKAGPTADIVEAIRMVDEIKKTINDIKNPEKSEWKSQMVDKSGKAVWNDKVSVTSEIPVVVDETWLFGIKHKKEERGPALTDLFRHVVNELVRKTTKI
jgi:hypothetical protein